MRHRIEMLCAAGVVYLAALAWVIWHWINAANTFLGLGRLESYFGAFALWMIAAIFSAGVVIGALDFYHAHEHRSRTIHLRPIPHH